MYEIEIFEDETPNYKNQTQPETQDDYHAVPIDSHELTAQLPQELRQLIKDERLREERKHKAPDSFSLDLQWPITSPRKDHRDGDIFIGRANNPFGHSTKWHYK